MMIFRGKLKSLLIKNWSSPRSPSLCRSLGASGWLFGTAFISNWFGCKLWLWFIKIHVRYCFFKFLSTTIWSGVLCNWNLCSSIGLQFRFVCMHWLQLETCHFAAMQYFYQRLKKIWPMNDWKIEPRNGGWFGF